METKSEIDPKKFKIAVVGAGSWGTAIADLPRDLSHPL
jgi:glycerol-3-phosphate dehydrogenase